MNIQQIINREIKYDYIGQAQTALDAYDLTLADLNTYEPIGRSNHQVLDTIYTKRFGEKANLLKHKFTCLCGHVIVEQCSMSN